MERIPEYLEQEFNMHPWQSERVQNDPWGYWYTFLCQTNDIAAEITEAIALGEAVTDERKDILQMRKICREKMKEIEEQIAASEAAEKN